MNPYCIIPKLVYTSGVYRLVDFIFKVFKCSAYVVFLNSTSLIISEIPYLLNKTSLIESIAKLIRDDVIKRIIPKSVDNSEIGLQIPSIDFIWRLIVQGVMYPPFIIPFHKFLEAFIWMFFESLFHGIKPLLHLAISLRMISSCCPKFYANLVQFLFKCRNCTFSFFCF